MLRFIKHHMDTIQGIEIYPIISLLIFFLFFSAVVWYAIKTPQESIDESEMLPFDDENTDNLL
ncbi:MAG: CcoQ/FixQ family Cbb3-type cytochrome c oxidase assembly chaperone [Flavobacteriales bacterium]|nr:CcoQ/FixQ family Cbb3-type cytochrome c oxidase assembly chaperone [Flavobacteriales bacterium]